ncbi:MAG: glycosyltransferase family 4 protein [Deltaproteobacteria bacterium]|nr:glycosyltransferase family 4 protein [Deltaproteobacteria bacterium]
MRIYVISPVFPPEPVVSSITSAQIARFLAAADHAVTVVTGFPNRPQGKLYPGYKRRLFQYKSSPDGYRLVRCFGFFSSRSTLWSRFLENISFGLTSGWFILKSCRPDVIYANTWTIFSAWILAIVAKVRGLRMVLNIQDIYPESLIAQERISPNGFIARWLLSIDRSIVKMSAAVIVPAPSFVDVYQNTRRLPSEKLHFVPNWYDTTRLLVDDVQAAEFRQKLRIPFNATMIFYGGNVGAAAGVETVIESFRYLKDVKYLYLTIAGNGANFDACKKLAADIDHPRIRFYTPWPAEETSKALAAADILILPTRGRQSLASIPSKLIAYMLAARPVLSLALPESDLAHIVRSSGCGWVIEPDRPAELADTLRKILSQSKDSLRSRGLSGREYTLSNFTGDVCLPKIASIISEAAA